MNDSQTVALLACLLGMQSNKAPEDYLTRAAGLLEAAYQTVNPEAAYVDQDEVSELQLASNGTDDDEDYPF